MKLSFSSKSDIGLVRQVNQDRWAHVNCDWGDLFVVADGLGHPEGGQLASQTTVDLLKEKFSETDPGEIPQFLRQTINETNRIVYDRKIAEYGNAMMGSTCVALVIQKDLAYLAHAGDSRAYYMHNGKLTQLTEDHSLVQEMVEEGLISKGEAENHPNKNIVTQAVGAASEVNPDIRQSPLTLFVGDKLLLCSDGLWGLVSWENLFEVLRSESPEDAIENFVDLAKQNGGLDNITVQVIHIIE